MIEFSSTNPYESLAAIIGDDPQDLINKIRAIKTPIKLVSIIPHGNRHVAYIMGDVRIKEVKKPKK